MSQGFFCILFLFILPSCFHFLRILLTLKSPASTLLKNGSSLHNFCNRLSVRRLGHEGWPFKPSCSLHIELCDKNRPFTLQKWLTFASKVAYFYIKSGLLFIVNGIVMNVKWRGDSLWQSMKALWRQHEGSKGQPSYDNRLIINKITFSMKAWPMFWDFFLADKVHLKADSRCCLVNLVGHLKTTETECKLTNWNYRVQTK